MKTHLFILLCLIINNYVYSMEYNTYEMTLEYEFEASSFGEGAEHHLAINTRPGGPDEFGPALYFHAENLVISDQVAYRTIYLNKDYTFNRIVPNSFYSGNVYQFENLLVRLKESTGLNIRDEEDFVSYLSFSKFKFLKRPIDIFYKSNTLFIVDSKNQLWSIKNPSTDRKTNMGNLRDEEQTRELLEQSEEYRGLEIDSENRFFLNGELKTINYGIFYRYYKSLNPTSNLSKCKASEIDDKNSSSIRYVGYDSDKNHYWDLLGALAICNSNGYLIDFIVYDRSKSSVHPANSPDGDIYFLNYDYKKPTSVKLYKTARQW